MKFCKNCGAQIADEAIICPNCGAAQDTPAQQPYQTQQGYGVQQPYQNQQAYGAQQPYQNQPLYGNQQPYGYSQQNYGAGYPNANPGAANDASSTGYAFLGFCIPIVGLILYLIWKDTTPLKAKSAGKGALIGFIVGIVGWIIYAIVVGVMVGSSGYYY